MTVNENPALYPELGYCVSRALLDGDEVVRYRDLLDSMIAGLAPGDRPEYLVEPHVNAQSWRDWLELCRHPRVLDAVRGVLGTDEVLLLMSHLIVKPAGDGRPVLWHQDNTYWASVDGTDVTTLWLAIDDAVIENGCLEVIPSTHAGHEAHAMIQTGGGDLLNMKIDVTPEMERAAVPVELAAGDAELHDSFIIHGSKPNHSARRRAGYTMRYANAETVAVDVGKHGKPVYYVSGSGAFLKQGMRDIRPGFPLPDHPGEHRSSRKKK